MNAPETETAIAASDAMFAPLEWWDVCSRAGEILWTRAAGAGSIAKATARRANDLIEFARATSPFYRERWRGLPQAGISLHELPVVTKPELMSRFDDWLTDRSVDLAAVSRFLADRTHIGEHFLGRYLVWKSSGSTGEPGIYVQDRAALATYDALLAVQMRSPQVASQYAWGLARGGRAALVAATGDHFASITSWQRVCRGTPWPNARAFSVMAPLPELVAELNEFQPAFLASYPTTLAMLASEQDEGRLRISPACVWAGGEYLSSTAHMAIERAFGAVLVNEYGASECLAIAHSCSRGHLHVNADWVVLEPVDRHYEPTPPGEPSHTVLLTNLANRVQPIIRYDLGDSVTASAEPCDCGSPLPMIRAEGRRDDVLSMRARDGSFVRLSPLALTSIVEEVIPHHRFQLVQTAPDEIDVRLDAGNARRAEWPAAQSALLAYLAHQSLDNVRLRLAAEAPVPDPRSGKFREVLADPRAITAH